MKTKMREHEFSNVVDCESVELRTFEIDERFLRYGCGFSMPRQINLLWVTNMLEPHCAERYTMGSEERRSEQSL